jgi:HD-like signal output (HDOD) protein
LREDHSTVKPGEIAARLIESDPTLTAELLAVVNSPLFVFRTTNNSPEQAVGLLGFDSTQFGQPR